MTALDDLLAAAIRTIPSSIRSPRIGLSCNEDYGDITVSIGESPDGEQAVDFLDDCSSAYAFADWLIPDLSMVDSRFAAIQQELWSPYEQMIRNDWSDLLEFDRVVCQQRLLESLCKRAAAIATPTLHVLVAGHDEHIRHTTARMSWAYRGVSDDRQAQLCQESWMHEQAPGVQNLLAFFHDRQFANHIRYDGEDEEIESSGDWTLAGSTMTMTATDTNLNDDDFLWVQSEYTVIVLDDDRFHYQEPDGDVWPFARQHRPDVSFFAP